MKVRSCRQTRAADAGDGLPLPNDCPFRDEEFRAVGVKGCQPVAVINDDGVAVGAPPTRKDDDAIGSGADGRPERSGDVHATVKPNPAQNRMPSVAEARNDRTADGSE